MIFVRGVIAASSFGQVTRRAQVAQRFGEFIHDLEQETNFTDERAALAVE